MNVKTSEVRKILSSAFESCVLQTRVHISAHVI